MTLYKSITYSRPTISNPRRRTHVEISPTALKFSFLGFLTPMIVFFFSPFHQPLVLAIVVLFCFSFCPFPLFSLSASLYRLTSIIEVTISYINFQKTGFRINLPSLQKQMFECSVRFFFF